MELFTQEQIERLIAVSQDWTGYEPTDADRAAFEAQEYDRAALLDMLDSDAAAMTPKDKWMLLQIIKGVWFNVFHFPWPFGG